MHIYKNDSRFCFLALSLKTNANQQITKTAFNTNIEINILKQQAVSSGWRLPSLGINTDTLTGNTERGTINFKT